jgi:hypothetical protein
MEFSFSLVLVLVEERREGCKNKIIFRLQCDLGLSTYHERTV